MTKELGQVKRMIKADSMMIPAFIDTKLVEDHHAYTILSNDIYPLLLTCCASKFLSYLNLEDVADEILLRIYQIRQDTINGVYINVYKYILRRCEYYQLYSEKYELYEVSQNFSRLIECLTSRGRKNV